MKVTIVGSGDAFASGGRAHTCIRIDTAQATTLVDFGATSMSGWKKLGFCLNDVDAVVITHLHGDHFGGLPFLLLDCQFVAHRTKPLKLVGPPGLKDRLHQAIEAFFPGATETPWTFAWDVEEIPPRRVTAAAGLTLESFEVLHPSGSLATGVRLSDGHHVFAYSGDTGWTDVLFDLADGADIFLVECYSGGPPIPHHMDWPTLAAKLPSFTAKRVVATHMSETALARRPDMEAAGLLVAYDGQSFDL